ncbi:MAG: AAA family ATPase [Proteobacteria bacterium]|nr:AAA family ATPase [Pseudomonadota bacterium]
MQDQFRQVIRQKIIEGTTAAPPVLTRRDIWLPSVANKATAVIGMRRAGKTSLLWQILADRLAQGTPRPGLLYFSFEDERLAGLQAGDLDIVTQEYYRLYPEWRDQRRTTLLLDEIQVVSGWELFARRILDSEQIDLYLSGSSARLLSREVATSMRGRAMEAVVLPFSYRECLRHDGLEPRTALDRLTKAERSMLDNRLLAYLEQGGFPEAQGLDVRNRYELLRSYVDVVLLRDVVERYAVSQPVALRWMVRRLLGNAAGNFSVNKFHVDLKSQGFAVGKDTLHNYLAYLEDAFLLFSLDIATDSEQRRRVNPRKVYPIDTSLIPLFDRSGKVNLGHALETAVFLELNRRGAEVAYIRTASGYEVDFLARHADGQVDLIQVCANIDQPDTLAREIRALHDAAGEFPGARSILITIDKPPSVAHPADITVLEARDWLLESSP